MMTKREAEITRNTKETQIQLKLNIDGTGESNINTGVGFLDHLLELFTRHGLFDLTVQAQGDIHVDSHHTVEDVGICLGKAFERALGDKVSIRRFGSFSAPMCEAIAHISLDICGRPYLVYNTPLNSGKVGEFDVELVEEFLHAFTNNSGITLHINVPYGGNRHHIIEAIFKATARALDWATSFDERVIGVPSTKGVL
jgi:imidazoleglycerol-phosphate dehydratase